MHLVLAGALKQSRSIFTRCFCFRHSIQATSSLTELDIRAYSGDSNDSGAADIAVALQVCVLRALVRGASWMSTLCVQESKSITRFSADIKFDKHAFEVVLDPVAFSWSDVDRTTSAFNISTAEALICSRLSM